jgi:uncharacterized protein
MKFSEGKIGRIFVIRLEDQEKLPSSIESFAKDKGVSCGMCILVGGVQEGGKIVAGPQEPNQSPIPPFIFQLSGIHEILGVGTIFPDEDQNPRLHMHSALGRAGETRAGCIRPGIEVWKVGEVILLEIQDSPAFRKKDPASGFEMLEP